MKNMPFTQVIIWVIIDVHVVIGYLNVHVIALPNNDLLVALLILL